MTLPPPPLWRPFSDLPRAYGGPAAFGRLRATPEDFQVEEIIGFEPDGEGEHALLRIRKTGANTEWVARRIASHAGLPVSVVGYAGLKDRNAVTTQWFSVHVGPSREPDWKNLDAEGVEVLEVHRHRRKLRRGTLRGNRFRIRVGGLEVESAFLDERLEQVRGLGVPNYFGPQRFGNDQGNLYGAHALFNGHARRVGRHLRGLWLSAARSQLFNEVLALRVERRNWDRPLPGDRMQLAGSRSHFLAETMDEQLLARTSSFDVDPSGPLWGVGELLTRGEAAEIERDVGRRFDCWSAGLASAGLRQERRPLRLKIDELEAEVGRDTLSLAFELPAGGYATAVLRELMEWSEPGDREARSAAA